MSPAGHHALFREIEDLERRRWETPQERQIDAPVCAGESQVAQPPGQRPVVWQLDHFQVFRRRRDRPGQVQRTRPQRASSRESPPPPAAAAGCPLGFRLVRPCASTRTPLLPRGSGTLRHPHFPQEVAYDINASLFVHALSRKAVGNEQKDACQHAAAPQPSAVGLIMTGVIAATPGD